MAKTEIKRKKARSPLRWVRRLMLLLGLLSIFSVVVLLAAYNFGRSAVDPVVEEGSTATNEEGVVRTGQGFDYTRTQENRPIWRIRAAGTREERDGNALLEDVELTLYRSDGNSYVVTSRSAKFNLESKHALLEGDVVMSGWENLTVRTRALELRREAQIVESIGEVQFDYPPDLTGRASKMRFDFRDDSFILSDGVHLRSIEGAAENLRLSSERLSFQQDKRVIRANNDVVVERDGDIVRAHTLSIFLREDRRTLESLRARFEVSGVLVDGLWPGPRLEARFSGGNLLMLFEPGGEGARSVDLEAAEGNGLAILELVDETGLRRRLVGTRMNGRLRQGRLEEVVSVGNPVTLVETVGDPEIAFLLRQACAKKIETSFDEEGQLRRLRLSGQVELSDGDMHLAGGDTATVDMRSGSVKIAGRNGVELFDNRGSITAPSFDYRRDKGVIKAKGGVRTILDERSAGALGRTPLGRGRGPIQVDSESGIWTLAPATFSYKGNVRAWRGDSLLLSDQLRGENETRKLSAVGNVRSIWQTGMPGQGGQPVEVTAKRLVYDDLGSALVYEGNVKILQESRRITCRQLTVELSQADRQAERMLCLDQVRVDDPSTGRRLFGDRAVYTLADRRVEVFGRKVRMQDADGNELEGRYLTYDVDSGSVHLKSAAPEGASPTP